MSFEDYPDGHEREMGAGAQPLGHSTMIRRTSKCAITTSLMLLMACQPSAASEQKVKAEIKCYASIEKGEVKLNFVNISDYPVFFCSYRWEYELEALDKHNKVLTDEDAFLDTSNLLSSIDTDWILLRPGARLQVPTDLATRAGTLSGLERVHTIKVKHQDRWERHKPPQWLVDLKYRQGKITFTTWRRK